MIKNTSSNSIWTISDTARGNGNFLQPHSQANELTGYSGVFQFAPIGFRLLDGDTGFNANTDEYVYVAIAAPPVT